MRDLYLVVVVYTLPGTEIPDYKIVAITFTLPEAEVIRARLRENHRREYVRIVRCQEEVGDA
jgi:hypothetical protein